MAIAAGQERRQAERMVNDEAFSAFDARVRAARIYVFYVMPALLALTTLLTIVQWLITPDDIPVAIWLACGLFWLLLALWIGLVRIGVDPLLIAGLSVIAVAGIEFAAMFVSAEPIGTSATLTFLIVVASYFLPAWITMAFATSCAVGITIGSKYIDSWGEGYAIPSTAFLAIITGVVCAFIMSRVRRTEQRLELAAENQLAARERVEQVDRARDRLIANVSHELRTPLTSTIGSIETLLRDDVTLEDWQRTRLLQLARDGGLRLLVLVEDLLTLGATRPDSLDLSRRPERLVQLVRDALAGIDPGPTRRIEVRVIDDPSVSVDRMRMLQVVANLAVNAVRHGEGNVVVETSADSTWAHVRVLDRGHGVAPEHLDELFLPFARFSARPDSTGLGLAICRTIVEAHGGAIRYSRTPEGATCFEVELPLATTVD